MPNARLGVALLLPPGVAAEVDGLRRALGDGSLGRIPPHLTLVPPVNVREDRLGDALAVLRAAAARTRPFGLGLGPPATFLPATPVVHLAVDDGDGAGLAALAALREAVFAEPLARPLTWPWVPHVTLADEAQPDRIAAAVTALAGYRVQVRFERVHLLQEGRGRVWEPLADAPFAPPAVVGRGGLPVELVTSVQPDPEARALAARATAPASGEPFAVTARRDGVVVGTAAGGVHGAEAELGCLVVAEAERAQGVGTRLLAAVESLAAERGCSSVVARPAPGEELAAFLRRRGWRDDPDPPAVLRRGLAR